MKKNTNKYEIKVITKKGEEILIDAEDFEKVKRYSWCISKTGYAVANNGKRVMKMHRYILNLDEPNIIVDHIDGNKLDNRKSNLRICKPFENARNVRMRKRNKVGYLGISYTAEGKYYICLQVNEHIKRDDYEVYMIEVIPESVGQYTGLHDRNGKEIYEGDIIKIQNKLCIVEYNYNAFGLKVIDKTKPYGWVEFIVCKCEVIGNIYENADLLKD